jgi:fumarylacetoacetate (FAA) hydrolase
MKLGTLRDGSRDGSLIVASRDGTRFTSASDIARTLQAALEDWDHLAPLLAARARALESGEITGAPLDVARLGPPLPRAYEWIDGSAYLNHVRLVRKARHAEPPATLETDPLVYQGGSGALLGPRDPFVLPDPAWGLDFEAEVGVILGDTPLGTRASGAEPHIRLVVLLNDWTHRALIPDELAKGFGFFQSKPSTAFAPFAVTPDELGDAWRDGRVHLRMNVWWNGTQVGRAHAGPEMHFGFHELVAHLCKTRAYCAGTILGSGTISNVDRSAGYSCIAEQRTIETIETGRPSTRWLAHGDHVAIEIFGEDGVSVFGRIEADVVAPDAPAR